MRSYLAIGLVAGIVGMTAVACGMANEDGSIDGGGDYGGGLSSGQGGASNQDDAGVDAEFGNGGQSPGAFDYSAWCGSGCQPATEADSPCGSMDGVGGGAPNGSGAGGGGGDCQLGVDEADGVSGQCVEAGAADKGMSCLTSTDCAPGLGCVQEGGQNVCRPYCCSSLEDCPQNTYCILKPLSTSDLPDGMQDAPSIPVCTPTTACTLLDDSTCDSGKTCTIVRVDGTTSCVTPGNGGAGQPCGPIYPCAAGHVCNTSKGECLQLCEVGGNSECPSGYTCQSGGQIYPTGYGVCVQT